MKVLIMSLLVMSSVYARVQTYECYDLYKRMRQQGQLHLAQANFTLKFLFEKHGRKAEVDGKIAVAYDWDGTGDANITDDDDAYTGVFNKVGSFANLAYDGDFYSHHYQYKVNASETTGAEDGMWGYLVVPKVFKKVFLAHYIFQSGDHMGGTLDLRCKVKKK